MASPSPLCTVANGAGAPVAQTNGVNVSAATVITVALANSAGCNVWDLTCVGTDDGNSSSSITAGIVVNQATKTATFTSPSGASAIILQSRVNRGLNANLQPDASLSTTLGIFVLLGTGLRLAADGETLEGSTAHGWTSKFNAAVIASGGGGLGAVVLSGTPANSYVPTATGLTTAVWAAPTSIPNNALTFGAVADGATNNSSALLAGATSVGTNGAIFLQPAASDYAVNTDTTINCALWVANDARIYVAAGKTLTVNGPLFCSETQKIFTGPGNVILKGNRRIYCAWFGTDLNGLVDSQPGVQKALNSAGLVLRTTVTPAQTSSTPPIVDMGSGCLMLNQPAVIVTQGITLEGAGSISLQLWTPSLGPVIMSSAFLGSLPVAAAPFGGPGNAFNLSNTNSGNYLTTANFLSWWENYHMSGPQIAGVHALCIRFFIKQTVLPAGPISFVTNASNRSSSDTPVTAIQIGMDSTGHITVNFQTKNGTPGQFLVATHTTATSINTWYHVEFDWDGTTARLFVGPADGSTNVMISAAVNGDLLVDESSIWSIGASQGSFPEATSGSTPTGGQIYSVEILTTTLHSAVFATPTAAHVNSANTLLLTNFELTGPNNEVVLGRYGSGTATNSAVYTMVRTGTGEVGNAFNGATVLRGFRCNNGGIYQQLTLHSKIEDVVVLNAPYGIWLNNNCYEGTVNNVQTGKGCYSFGLMWSQAGGLANVSNSDIESAWYALAFTDAGTTVSNVYAETDRGISCFVKSSGGNVNIAFSGLDATDEGSNGHIASVFLDGNVNATFNACTIEVVLAAGYSTPTVYNGGTAYVVGNTVRLTSTSGIIYKCIANTTGNTPPNVTYWAPVVHDMVVVSGKSPRATFNDCSWNDNPTVPARIKFQGALPRPGAILVHNGGKDYGDAQDYPWSNVTASPLPYALAGVNGWYTGVMGVSSTATPCRNLSGQYTVSGASTTGQVTFPTLMTSIGNVVYNQTLSSTTLTLASGSTINNFPIGTAIAFSATNDGSAGAIKAGVSYVVAANYGAATMQLSATRGGSATALNTLVPTIAVNDFIFAVNAEDDTAYRVTITPSSSTGSPAAGSNRVLSVAKSMTGFVPTHEAAPGGGATYTFDWQMSR